MARRPNSNPFDDDDDNESFGQHKSREQIVIRRMEESSANALRKLNETYRMGVDTTVELDHQAEKLDNVERKLDEIHSDVDKSKKNVSRIKSPFGGIFNRFSKQKDVSEITDPKDYKPPSISSNPSRSKPKSSPKELRHYESTGSAVVDSNLDEMSRQLNRMMGVGELIGVQLDDSKVQIDRIDYKMGREQEILKSVTKDINKQL